MSPTEATAQKIDCRQTPVREVSVRVEERLKVGVLVYVAPGRQDVNPQAVIL
jgi:hypothetical protein